MEKAKYWQSIMYPDNMIDNWEDEISHLLEVPYAYCIHDKDIDKHGDLRVKHVHIIIVYNNTTTLKHAIETLKRLQKESDIKSFKEFTVQAIINIRHAYDYLIHDTEDCRKKHKYLYPVTERITGNGFDIGSYEQLSIAEKNDIARTMCNIIIDNNYCNFADFYMYVVS